VIEYKQRQIIGDIDRGETGMVGWIVTWPDMKVGDIGRAVSHALYPRQSIQVEGVFGVGGSAACQGSNDFEGFHALTTPLGSPVAVTAETRIAAVTEPVIYFRPWVSGGDDTTLLTVTMVFLRAGQ
jgi:hypothetical protein